MPVCTRTFLQVHICEMINLKNLDLIVAISTATVLIKRYPMSTYFFSMLSTINDEQ